MEASEDRRVQRTKTMLRSALAVLMTKKTLRNITVRELTEMADLNRATFYLHYRDVFDMQQQIEDEVIRELDQIFRANQPRVVGLPSRCLFLAILQYVSTGTDVCQMLLGKNASRTFLDKLGEMVEKHYVTDWLHQYNIKDEDTRNISYLSGYMVYGYVAIVARWVEAGMQEPPEEIAKMMQDIGLATFSYVQPDWILNPEYTLTTHDEDSK
ncbi:MAG: TetR/AcrR family transcriptional regulator [Oscillospiraceae bacterium]